jgi:hypothetical protein
MLRRGHAHFWEEGAKINNVAKVHDPYYTIALKTRQDGLKNAVEPELKLL